ncbi:serine/threonine protein phosphatase [Alsobacter soli]|uniref:non-specific serine/threonine protein kinase n=1 Tax=Alsobacter soli TaxID=2109933 RepID=A0A2T1HU25_9HYPH|nr:ATPase domain-containing protein [Alsobacter soli]PSC05144.1 serine/threonine protein phosphatase [Alsobacter soli]
MNETTMQRTPTTIPGLDRLLGGGVFRGGIYIVQGAPGSGKTILANQLCFGHAAAGGRALYVTLLAESHSRMIGHLENLAFFDRAAIPDRVTYLSAFRTLEDDGLKGLVDMLRREIRSKRISLLVLDGLVSAEETATSPRELKKFIHELQTQAGLTDCTMFLLTSAYMGQRMVSAEHTMVDGLVELQSSTYGRQSERELQIHKFRGGAMIRGLHSYVICDNGIEVYPRTEALYAKPSRAETADGPTVSIGIPVLDGMMGGGPSVHSTTLLLGPAGIGKSTVGLQFLGHTDEPGLYFSFNESPQSVLVKAKGLKLPVAQRIKDGQVRVHWQPVTEAVVDAVCDRLLRTVEQNGIRRLFIDGVDGFAKLSTDTTRIGPLLTALSNELRARSVTTLSTAEMDLAGIVPGQPLAGMAVRDMSPVADNIIVMRYVGAHSHLHRLVAALKVREGRTSMEFRRFRLEPGGLHIEADAAVAERLLRGLEERPEEAQALQSAPHIPDHLGRGE